MKLIFFYLLLSTFLIPTISSAAENCGIHFEIVTASDRWILSKTSEQINGPINARELNAIYYYTDRDFVKFNEVLRKWETKDLLPEPEILKDIAALMSGLRKLPAVTYKVNRFDQLPVEFLDSLSTGKQFKISSFWSSTKLSSLEAFDSRTSNVKFIIESKTGRDISSHSLRPEEEEVLFMPKTYFEVISQSTNPEGKRIINLRELYRNYPTYLSRDLYLSPIIII